MADNSWMLPPKLRYKQRKFGTKEAEMLMMCNHRSQEAELERRYKRLDVALQDFLRKYRHEVWEVRHFLRNIGRIETPQNRLGLLPTEKYEEEIFNAKLRAHNLRKKKRQEQQADESPPYTYDTEDEMTYTRLTDTMDRSSLTASSHTRTKSSVTVDDHEYNADSILPDISKRSPRKGSAVSIKQRKKSYDAGNKTCSTPSASVRQTPTGLDPIMENGCPPLGLKTNQKTLHRTLSTVSCQDSNPMGNSQSVTSIDEDQAVHLPKI